MARGEMVAIVGASGAGKSTTINTISGILRAKSGTILFDGRNMERLSSDKIVEAGVVQMAVKFDISGVAHG